MDDLTATDRASGERLKLRLHCSWCYSYCFHHMTESNVLLRCVYECSSCHRRTLKCLFSETCQGATQGGDLWDDNLCAVCDGSLYFWPADRAPQSTVGFKNDFSHVGSANNTHAVPSASVVTVRLDDDRVQRPYNPTVATDRTTAAAGGNPWQRNTMGAGGLSVEEQRRREAEEAAFQLALQQSLQLSQQEEVMKKQFEQQTHAAVLASQTTTAPNHSGTSASRRKPPEGPSLFPNNDINKAKGKAREEEPLLFPIVPPVEVKKKKSVSFERGLEDQSPEEASVGEGQGRKERGKEAVLRDAEESADCRSKAEFLSRGDASRLSGDPFQGDKMIGIEPSGASPPVSVAVTPSIHPSGVSSDGGDLIANVPVAPLPLIYPTGVSSDGGDLHKEIPVAPLPVQAGDSLPRGLLFDKGLDEDQGVREEVKEVEAKDNEVKEVEKVEEQTNEKAPRDDAAEMPRNTEGGRPFVSTTEENFSSVTPSQGPPSFNTDTPFLGASQKSHPRPAAQTSAPVVDFASAIGSLASTAFDAEKGKVDSKPPVVTQHLKPGTPVDNSPSLTSTPNAPSTITSTPSTALSTTSCTTSAIANATNEPANTTVNISAISNDTTTNTATADASDTTAFTTVTTDTTTTKSNTVAINTAAINTAAINTATTTTSDHRTRSTPPPPPPPLQNTIRPRSPSPPSSLSSSPASSPRQTSDYQATLEDIESARLALRSGMGLDNRQPTTAPSNLSSSTSSTTTSVSSAPSPPLSGSTRPAAAALPSSNQHPAPQSAPAIVPSIPSPGGVKQVMSRVDYAAHMATEREAQRLKEQEAAERSVRSQGKPQMTLSPSPSTSSKETAGFGRVKPSSNPFISSSKTSATPLSPPTPPAPPAPPAATSASSNPPPASSQSTIPSPTLLSPAPSASKPSKPAPLPPTPSPNSVPEAISQQSPIPQSPAADNRLAPRTGASPSVKETASKIHGQIVAAQEKPKHKKSWKKGQSSAAEGSYKPTTKFSEPPPPKRTLEELL